MSLEPLPMFEVPAVDAMPSVEGRSFDVVGCTDFLLTQLLRRHAGLLHSDFRCDEGRWRILSWSGEAYDPEEVVAVIPEIGRFRTVLAHLGVRFLGGQVYGGFAEGFFDHRGTSKYFALYMANDSLRGYWVRLYVRAAS